MKILVTGGAGFIGSALIRHSLKIMDISIVNVDKLTYAGNLESLQSVEKNPRYVLEVADICDPLAMRQILAKHAPDSIIHLAAESHVDRSISGPAEFIRTNIFGTYVLLEEANAYYSTLSSDRQKMFRFLHVSTDEVYGELSTVGVFSEKSAYAPNSPYSASKASSDHLVRAWGHTFKLPVLITHCSNNYGPYQFPEKLIPLMILNGMQEKPMPVYGDGANIRDWISVDDHAEGLLRVLFKGKIGETYNLGGESELSNLKVVQAICDYLDLMKPLWDGSSHHKLITFVQDRAGHDLRYAIDIKKISKELGWNPTTNFSAGLKLTVEWYLKNSTQKNHSISTRSLSNDLFDAVKA